MLLHYNIIVPVLFEFVKRRLKAFPVDIFPKIGYNGNRNTARRAASAGAQGEGVFRLTNYAEILAKEFSIRPAQASAAIELMDAGNTIPFIARYRKEATGSLDDQVLRELLERLEYLRGLDKRRE